MQREKTGKHDGLLRLISGGLALVMCFLLMSNAGTVLLHANAEETGEVTMDSKLQAEWDALLAKADEETRVVLPEKPDWDALFGEEAKKEEALGALEICAEAWDFKCAFDEAYRVMTETAESWEFVPPETLPRWEKNKLKLEKASLLETTETLQETTKKLATNLLNGTVEETNLEDLGICRTELEALTVKVTEIHKQGMELQTIAEQLDQIRELKEELKTAGMEALCESLQEQYDELDNRFQKTAKRYWHQWIWWIISPIDEGEKWAALEESVVLLKQDVEAFGWDLTMNGLTVAAQKQVKTETENRNLSNRMVFAFVALGVAAVGVLMAVVATVLALRSKEETLDVSQLASREAVEVLEQQHQALQKQQELQGKKLDNVYTVVESVKQGLAEQKTVEKAPETQVTPEKKSEPSEQEQPEHPPQPVKFLTLKYQKTNPDNSYFEVDSKGKYALYADGSVALARMDEAYDELKGWRDEGLLYLFDVEINGKWLRNNQEELPFGYYKVTKTIRGAKVVQSILNNYKLESKGSIQMRS